MLKTSLLTTSFTATEALPSMLWPRQPASSHDNPVPFWQRWLTSSDQHRTLRKLKWLNRRLRRGQPILVGSVEAPCDLAATLRWLRHLEHSPMGEVDSGAAMTLIARQTATVEPIILEPLAEIDQRHALRVDLLLTSHDLCDLRGPSWTTLRTLTDLGLASRIGVPHVPRLSDGEDDLRHLFELAVDGGAFDLVVSTPLRRSLGFGKIIQPPPGWLVSFERLRLEHGLPSTCSGRG